MKEIRSVADVYDMESITSRVSWRAEIMTCQCGTEWG